jgi:hypothetical protein
MKDGRRFGKPPTPYTPPATPEGKVNVTDPDSRNVKTPRGYMQGYNAQAVCNENQIIVAAEINTDSPDFGHLEPVVAAAERELADAGVAEAPAVVVADAGYWHHDQMDQLVRQTPGHDRAGLRQRQVQPPARPLLTPRQSRLPVRMAPHHRHPQPAQAPHAPDRGGGRLTAPRCRARPSPTLRSIDAEPAQSQLAQRPPSRASVSPALVETLVCCRAQALGCPRELVKFQHARRSRVLKVPDRLVDTGT